MQSLYKIISELIPQNHILAKSNINKYINISKIYLLFLRMLIRIRIKSGRICSRIYWHFILFSFSFLCNPISKDKRNSSTSFIRKIWSRRGFVALFSFQKRFFIQFQPKAESRLFWKAPKNCRGGENFEKLSQIWLRLLIRACFDCAH